MRQKKGQKISAEQLCRLKSCFYEVEESRSTLLGEEGSDPLVAIAEREGIHLRTIKKYWKDRALLDTALVRLESGAEKRVLWWKTSDSKLMLIREVGRLLCCHPPKLDVRYSFYLSPAKMKSRGKSKKSRGVVLGGRTLRNHLYCLFETTGEKQMSEILKDRGLREIAKKHLGPWLSGTFAVHGVRLEWTEVDQVAGRRRGRPPSSCLQRGTLLMVADRSNPKTGEILIALLPEGFASSQLNAFLSTVFNSENTLVETVRMVTRLDNDKAVMTMAGAKDLIDAIGGISLECDAPTLHIPSIKFPGSYKSIKDAESAVWKFLNRGSVQRLVHRD